jgi:hypothetical protein
MRTWPSGPGVSAAGRGRRRRASHSSREERCPGRPERGRARAFGRAGNRAYSASRTRRSHRKRQPPSEPVDPLAFLGQVLCPVHVMAGSKSSVMPPQKARRFAGVIPDEEPRARRRHKPSPRARSTQCLRREDHRADAKLALARAAKSAREFGRVTASWHMSAGLSPAGAGLNRLLRA